MTDRFRRYLGCLMGSLVLTLVDAGTSAAVPFVIPEVFEAPTAAATRTVTTVGHAVVRQRAVTARLGALTNPDGSARLAAGQRIGLKLFNDADFAATVTEVTRFAHGGHTFSAKLDGVDHGYAVLAVNGGALAGTVVLPGAVYRVGYAADGTQVIEEIDTSVLPREADPIPAPVSPTPLVVPNDPVAATDGPVEIDVMVLYTAAARAKAGGTAAMLAEVGLAVATTNQAYANNGLVQRLRLVFAGEVAITETNNFSADLDALKRNATVSWMRDMTRADLVSLIVSNVDAAFCGVGYLMVTNSTAFAPSGYSVVERTCASANLTFAHELGHNMGAHHDLFVSAGDQTLFAYSHGHVDLVARFRTIMAYPDQCAATPPGTSCPKIPFFSTPDLQSGGRIIGTALTSDNSRTLGQTAGTIANLRQVLTSPPSASASASPSILAGGQTLVLGGGVANPGLSGTADVYVGLLTAGGTAIFVTNAAEPTKDTVVGSVVNVASFRPIVTGVPLSTPFSVNIPNILSYSWTGTEPHGGYVFFVFMVKSGALTDGVFNSDKLLAAALARFSFP
jgi:hypothetical protein